MYTLNEIIAAANECKEALVQVQTMQDLINLCKNNERIDDYNVCLLDIGNGLDVIEYSFEEIDETAPVHAIRLNYYKASNDVILDYPTIEFDDQSKLVFDVYELAAGCRDRILAVEDATVDTVEEMLKKYHSDKCILITGIQWDTDGEDIDLPDEVYIPFEVEDDEVADYLSDMFDFCVICFDPIVRNSSLDPNSPMYCPDDYIADINSYKMPEKNKGV